MFLFLRKYADFLLPSNNARHVQELVTNVFDDMNENNNTQRLLIGYSLHGVMEIRPANQDQLRAQYH